MFGTPKLIEALCLALEERGSSLAQTGITGIFSGGTEFTPQWTRFCTEELFGGPPEVSGIYMTPTYGNTLMGLACSAPVTAADGYKISYYAPQPRAVVEVVDFDDHESARRLRRNGPREAHHAHQRVLHAGLSGTRRRRTRAALRAVSLGRHQRHAAVPQIGRGDNRRCILG